MTEMIEKVARALFASECAVYTDDERMFEPYPYDDLDEIEKASLENRAKAAIEAMRKPAAEMLEAGADTGVVNETYFIWDEMINAALKEPRND